MRNNKADLCKRLQSEIYTKKTKSNEGKVLYQASFSRRPDMSDQAEIFKSYYGEFVKKEVLVDLKDKNVRDIAGDLNVTIMPSSSSDMALVIGKEDEVKNFIDDTDKSSQKEENIQLPPERISLLKSSGFLQELEKSLSVKIVPDGDQLRVTGPEQKIDKVEAKLSLKISNIKEEDVAITSFLSKLLKDQRAGKDVEELMQRQRIIFTLDSGGKKMHFLAMSEADLKNGIEIFKTTFVETNIPLKQSEAAFFEGPIGSKALYDALKGQPLVMQKTDKNIKIAGMANVCNNFRNQIKEILQDNPFIKKFLPFSFGMTRAVLMIFEDRINEMRRKYSNYQISIEKSNDECSIVVSGYGEGITCAVDDIKKAGREVVKNELVFQRPGLSKVIDLESFRHMISGLEREKKVIIIRKEDDKAGSMPVEEIEKEYEVISSAGSSLLLCKHKTDGGQILAVFQGDITRHSADVIVNAANSRLQLGGGVAGAIESAGGRGIQDECNQLIKIFGTVNKGEVVTTSGGRLQCRRIIHAVGPMWPTSTRAIGEIELKHKKKYSKETLGEAMKNILKKAEEEECRVLAVPAISSGIYGFPKDICAKILIKSTSEMLAKSSFQHLKEIHFINNDKPTVQVFYDEFVTSFGMRPTFEKVHDIREPQVNASNSVRMRTDSVKKLAGRQSQRETKTKVGGQGNATDTVVSAGNGLEIELVIGDLAKVEVSLFIFCFCLVNAFR